MVLMTGFLEKIKKLFSRRKEEPPRQQQPPEAQQPIEIKQSSAQPEQKPQRKDPERPEKICQRCGAPNDVFVKKCWLCKQDV
ncbi:MAG: hypothetical protein HY368_00745 [Candidatus Aenigmarchaeota archaeon]|nr:hypothetical protein [Candidatus Aenigmarchaeota archaeon]